MATKTYYAKQDCYVSPANQENVSDEFFKNFCDFMTYVSASNKVELVTWNSGSSAVAGSFESRTYWDGSQPFGAGAHALWKIKSNDSRPWDWYLYAQVAKGSTAINQAFNQPIVCFGGANFPDNGFGGGRGILVQAATCFSGSTSFNPWNGTISQGNSTAGNPRWISGSSDRTLYVLPRSNDLGGSHATSRNNSISTFEIQIQTAGAEDGRVRHHMLFDGDSICILYNLNLTVPNAESFNRHVMSYIGPFELRGSLSGSGIAGSEQGFMLLRDEGGNSPVSLPKFNTAFGDTAGTTRSSNGGISVPVGIAVSGSRSGILQIGSNAPFDETAHQPNYYTGNYDEFPITAGISETPNFAFLGQMNYGLCRLVLGRISYDVNSDLSRAIIAGGPGGGVLGSYMLSIPWTGSLGPGVLINREGANFTWTKDYG